MGVRPSWQLALRSESWDYYNQPARKRFSALATPTCKRCLGSWGPLDVEESELFDVQNVDWAIAELGKSHEKPFFIACGFKPHMPWYAPRKYFDLHPIEDIILPDTLDNDRDDLPYWGKRFATEVHDVSGFHETSPSMGKTTIW